MNKVLLSFFVFGAMLSASTVNVSFQSANPSLPIPVENGGLAGPYTLSVNGSSVLAMCMDDFRGVSGTWTAAATSLASSDFSHTVLGNNTTNVYGYQLTSKNMYSMEAYLFKELIQPGADRANLQLAAWALMDPTTLNTVVNSTNAIAKNDLLTAYNNMSTVNASNFQILSDITGKNQEFMVASPEPGTIALLGVSLFGVGTARFFRRKKVLA